MTATETAKGAKKYTVAKAFTDKAGKQWQQGQDYSGSDPSEVQQQVNQGNLTEKQG